MPVMDSTALCLLMQRITFPIGRCGRGTLPWIIVFVAVSRVKTLGGLLFEALFDFDRFNLKGAVTSQEREQDHPMKSMQLL